MSDHTEFGRKAENLAAQWLTAKGYEIINRNWRSGRYEVDIIAKRDGVYHFLEVKASRSISYGYPEGRVGKNKIRHMMLAATAWLCQIPGTKRAQYDVLSILIQPGKTHEFYLLEDVYS